jgi:hypothetical protein
MRFKSWLVLEDGLSAYERRLDESLRHLLVEAEEQESGFLAGLKSSAKQIMAKVHASTSTRPSQTEVDSGSSKILAQLREKYAKYANEDYPLDILAGFNFFDHIKGASQVQESFGAVGKAILKGIWVILKWLFIGLADLINASLDMLRNTLTEEGFFKLIIFWVGPAILASPVMGLQALYGLSNLIGLTPFIGWVIWNVFVKPAMFRMGGAKRMPIGKMDPDDEHSPNVIGGWSRPAMA